MFKEGVSFVLGLDISTKTIGVTLADINGKLYDMFYISLPKSSKKVGEITIYNKLEYFVERMDKYKDVNIRHIYIEEPLKNGPNINTVVLLASFNGMVSNKLYEMYKVIPQHISVYEARCLFFPEYVTTCVRKGEVKQVLSFPKDADKKKYVYDKVNWLEPQFVWEWSKNFVLKEENFDMADSYVVVKAGLMKFLMCG